MVREIDPSDIARSYRREIKKEISELGFPIKLVGLLANDAAPSKTYANYTNLGCADVGVFFDLRQVRRVELENELEKANRDSEVSGIIVYYPVFGVEQDNYIKDQVFHSKDVEGLNSFWTRKLYLNERYIDQEKTRKAILPCTPLAIVKLLEETQFYDLGSTRPLAGKKVTIFNRSEVVGRPLATMMANDGAEVFSFDLDGPILFRDGKICETEITRKDALGSSDIIITGVPSRDFPLVRAEEISSDAICVNFSTLQNYTAEAKDKARIFIPRVGPMTVTMALRNTLRLYRNYHQSEAKHEIE